MPEPCDNNCATCNQDCDKRGITKLTPLEDTHIKKIIGVISGKGGVGKSLICSLLAVELAHKGYKVGIMDADITGPSIPALFNIHDSAYGDKAGIYPAETPLLGMEVLSANMLLESEDTPILWRGPLIGQMVRRFYNEVHWGDLDYLLIDMPPGTGDVALTVMQELPIDGLVMVTNPAKLVAMIVSKAIVMAEKTNTKLLGLVENMAYVECPDCHKHIYLYPNDQTEALGEKYDLSVLASLPLSTALAQLVEKGALEEYQETYLEKVVSALL